MRTVLIATTGMSPAVLTETVWALAQESPAVIPDDIVVITTVSGRQKIEEQLFGQEQVWESLRASLLPHNDAEHDTRLSFALSDIVVARKKVGVKMIEGISHLPVEFYRGDFQD